MLSHFIISSLCEQQLRNDCFFPSQDIIAIGIAAGGYFCGALPMAVYAGQWGDSSLNGTGTAVQSSTSATSVSCVSIAIV